MNEKPFIERLKTAYDEQRFSWFVIDGQGNTMAEGLDEISAREYSMKDSDYSIGCDDAPKDVTGDKINAEGIPITYENKDILSEEDFK